MLYQQSHTVMHAGSSRAAANTATEVHVLAKPNLQKLKPGRPHSRLQM